MPVVVYLIFYLISDQLKKLANCKKAFLPVWEQSLGTVRIKIIGTRSRKTRYELLYRLSSRLWILVHTESPARISDRRRLAMRATVLKLLSQFGHLWILKPDHARVAHKQQSGDRYFFQFAREVDVGESFRSLCQRFKGDDLLHALRFVEGDSILNFRELVALCNPYPTQKLRKGIEPKIFPDAYKGIKRFPVRSGSDHAIGDHALYAFLIFCSVAHGNG